MSLSNILSKLGFSLEENFIISKRKNVSAFINPTAYISVHKTSTIAYGPRGSVKLNSGASKNITNKLIKSGFLFRCNSKDRPQIEKLFKDDALSRTNSFLLNETTSINQFFKLIKLIPRQRVLIIGCGGIGCNVTYLLAGLGFRRMTLIDPDKVEISNLNRQVLYERNETGLYKVDVLKKALQMRFKHLQIKTSKKLISAESAPNFFPQYDIIVLSADNPPNLYQLVADKSNKRIFSGGYRLNEGVVSVLKKERESFSGYRYLFPELNIPASSGIINYKVSAALASKIIRYLNGDIRENVFETMPGLS